MGAREPRLSESHNKVNRNRVTQYQVELGQRRYIRPHRGFVAVRLFSLGERTDLATGASDREGETDTKVAECIEAKRTHVSTSRFIVCTPLGIHLFSAATRWRFRPEGTKKSPRDFFRKMNFLLPFTLVSAPVTQARLLHKISCPTCVNGRSILYITNTFRCGSDFDRRGQFIYAVQGYTVTSWLPRSFSYRY